MRRFAPHFLKVATPAVAFLVLGLFADAQATIITNLFDTGTLTSTSNGSVLAAPSSVDTNYAISGAFPTGPFVERIFPNQYVGNTSDSQFIGPNANGFIGFPTGTTDFTTTFTITGGLFSASLSGQVAADDEVTIFLNGHNEGTHMGFTAFNPFTISSGFVVGTNVLTFSVTNLFANTPTALQVHGLEGSYAVPEPTSMALMGIGGVAAFGFSRFRRQRAARA
jgi:PEP-CTERM motif